MAKIIEQGDFEGGKAAARELVAYARALAGHVDLANVVALAVQLVAQVTYDEDQQTQEILSGLAIGIGATMAKAEIPNGAEFLLRFVLPRSMASYQQGQVALGHTHGQTGHG